MKGKGKYEEKIKNSILVFNIPLETSSDELNTLFNNYGKVLKINQYFIPWKMTTFNAKIFFEDSENAKEAKNSLDGAQLDENTLKIIFN